MIHKKTLCVLTCMRVLVFETVNWNFCLRANGDYVFVFFLPPHRTKFVAVSGDVAKIDKIVVFRTCVCGGGDKKASSQNFWFFNLANRMQSRLFGFHHHVSGTCKRCRHLGRTFHRLGHMLLLQVPHCCPIGTLWHQLAHP